MPWEVIDLGDSVHTVPLGGEETHDPEPTCWCSPKVEAATESACLMVFHRAHGELDHAEERTVEM